MTRLKKRRKRVEKQKRVEKEPREVVLAGALLAQDLHHVCQGGGRRRLLQVHEKVAQKGVGLREKALALYLAADETNEPAGECLGSCH